MCSEGVPGARRGSVKCSSPWKASLPPRGVPPPSAGGCHSPTPQIPEAIHGFPPTCAQKPPLGGGITEGEFSTNRHQNKLKTPLFGPPQRAVCSCYLRSEVARGLSALDSCCVAEFVHFPAAEEGRKSQRVIENEPPQKAGICTNSAPQHEFRPKRPRATRFQLQTACCGGHPKQKRWPSLHREEDPDRSKRHKIDAKGATTEGRNLHKLGPTT